jgi:hypothetical protein
VFTLIRKCDEYYIGKILEARDYISGLRPRQKRDFNDLFGFKYDPATQRLISGVSPQGK